jgi:hypothetical protein
MKHVLSFSLWGDNPKYTVGAIRNAELARTIYDGWICRFYIGSSTPDHVVRELAAFSNVEIVQMDEPGDWSGMLWRFAPCSGSDVQAFVSRDTDSRLSRREKAAVDEWLDSKHGFHIMRDHPLHEAPILGGMWGCKRGVLSDMSDLIEGYSKGDFWQVDQNFLRNVVYPRVQFSAVVHDEFFDRCPFPTKRRGLEFVGEVFDENENFVREHRSLLQEFLLAPTQLAAFRPRRRWPSSLIGANASSSEGTRYNRHHRT